MPITRNPCSASTAATTLLSTPPDIATATVAPAGKSVGMGGKVTAAVIPVGVLVDGVRRSSQLAESVSSTLFFRLTSRLHTQRDAHPATDAQGRQPLFAATTLQFMQQGYQHPRATGANWMAKGNRAAVDIHLG